MSPRKQIPESHCVRCGARPRIEGLRICEHCREYQRRDVPNHRERNRAYYHRNRDAIRERERQKAASARVHRVLNGDIPKDVRARMRDRIALAYAEELGRVPTTNELHRLFARNGHALTQIACAKLRRRAFNLRPLERYDPAASEHRMGWPVVPYPVPVAFLASDPNMRIPT